MSHDDDWRADLIDPAFFDDRLFNDGCPTDVVRRGTENLIDPLPYRRHQQDRLWGRQHRPASLTIPDSLVPEERWVTSYLRIKARSRSLTVMLDDIHVAVSSALYSEGLIWLPRATGNVLPDDYYRMQPATEPVTSIGWWLALVEHHRSPHTMLFVHHTTDDTLRRFAREHQFA